MSALGAALCKYELTCEINMSGKSEWTRLQVTFKATQLKIKLNLKAVRKLDKSDQYVVRFILRNIYIRKKLLQGFNHFSQASYSKVPKTIKTASCPLTNFYNNIRDNKAAWKRKKREQKFNLLSLWVPDFLL